MQENFMDKFQQLKVADVKQATPEERKQPLEQTLPSPLHGPQRQNFDQQDPGTLAHMGNLKTLK